MVNKVLILGILTIFRHIFEKIVKTMAGYASQLVPPLPETHKSIYRWKAEIQTNWMEEKKTILELMKKSANHHPLDTVVGGWDHHDKFQPKKNSR